MQKWGITLMCLARVSLLACGAGKQAQSESVKVSLNSHRGFEQLDTICILDQLERNGLDCMMVNVSGVMTDAPWIVLSRNGSFWGCSVLPDSTDCKLGTIEPTGSRAQLLSYCDKHSAVAGCNRLTELLPDHIELLLDCSSGAIKGCARRNVHRLRRALQQNGIAPEGPQAAGVSLASSPAPMIFATAQASMPILAAAISLAEPPLGPIAVTPPEPSSEMPPLPSVSKLAALVAEATSEGFYNQTPLLSSNAATGPAAVSSTIGSAVYVVPNYTTNAGKAELQWFLAGASLGTVFRAEAIPGRVFYDADGVTEKDPFDVMESAGFNAVRVETFIKSCTGPSPPFNNSGDVLFRELNYLLDAGCIDVQVKTAQLAKSRNMKLILTVNLGTAIPTPWLHFNYTQMLQAIDVEVRRQITPFLQAGIQPDIVLLENEGTAGLLFSITLPNGQMYSRGAGDNPSVPAAQLYQETCGLLPSGYFSVYPQLAGTSATFTFNLYVQAKKLLTPGWKSAGYYKQEILSISSALQQAGFNASGTRFGLHSHGQYVDFKQSIVYSTDPLNEVSVSSNNITCNFTGVIPSDILTLRASEMLDIMAFSSYPNPITPAFPFTTSSMQATFAQLRTTLGLMNQVALRYGKFNSGLYTDQYIKQGLAIEYASAFSYPSEVEHQQQHTQLYFDTLKAYPWFLGALWFEPTYTYNNWEGGKGSLYHNWNSSNTEQTPEAPYAMLTTWASFAQSPVPSV